MIFDEIYQRCVPARQCPCLHGGEVYFDGDKVKSDEEQCQTCYCNAGQVKCVGVKGCVTTTTEAPVVTTSEPEQTTTTVGSVETTTMVGNEVCENGWTNWTSTKLSSKGDYEYRALVFECFKCLQ